ncbi:HD domain-containing protein [Salirhabdus sp. Marseille-P4669]|uniref:HD domain-containing protein n=1 Tax=Salirhabdus sp. Marseille-P4669 TaxID=2042310 RepID=UPI000C7C200D|nr:HD domain-containing protein [Salirhabdus sp. Marseille-P4669]
MDDFNVIQEATSWVREIFEADATGHDFSHIERVVKMSRYLAMREEADIFVCEMAALLHDVADEKLTEDVMRANEDIDSLLQTLGVSQERRNQIKVAMKDVSFKGNHQVPKTLEGQIVQDADRLDAIGALGIARTFAYGGSKGHKMHDPDWMESYKQTDYRDENKTTVYHFYEKLLKLKDLMNTQSAKSIAEKRHQFMESFLDQFYREWEGTDF